MNLVPSGWSCRPLGAVVDVLDHRRVPVNARERAERPGPVPYYGATGQVGWIDDALFDEDLVLLGEDGVQFFDPDRPKAYLISGPAWVNNHAHVLRPQTDVVDRRYLCSFLNAFDFHGFANGTTRLKLTKSAMLRIPVIMPSLEEQRRIVALLEDHLSRLDAASGYLEAARQRLRLMSQAVHEAAIRGFLVEPGHQDPDEALARLAASRTGLQPSDMKRGRPVASAAVFLEPSVWPNHWVSTSLEAVTDPVRTISYGILKPGPNIPGGVPYVRVINMRDDRLDLAGLHRTSGVIAQQYSRSTLAQGDVLISIRGTYGRVVEVPAELDGANITQDTARLAFIGGVDPRFASVYLRSRYAQTHLRRVARGVAVKGVNIADLRAVPFPVPPLEEQRRIVARVSELITDLTAALGVADKAARRDRQLRHALMQAALSGALISDQAKEMSVV